MTHTDSRHDLPGMDPAFVAATIEALPGRLQKRLGSADLDSWTISSTTVTVGTATVTLHPPASAECDCLLSPRCLHLAQVLMACPPAAASPDDTADSAELSEPADVDGAADPASVDEPLTLTDDQLATLSLAEECLRGLLDRGLGGLTAMDSSSVLWLVSAGRVQRLPSLAGAFARLHGELGSADGRVTEAAISLLVDAALVTHQLRHGHDAGTLSIDAVGTARRTYQPVGGLKLRGWACEPVLTKSGYAGVITYLVDERDGYVWQLPSVVPGDETQVDQAYRASAGFAELGLSHHDLARSGLLLTHATASADGRLGRGAKVRASARTPDETAVPAQGWWIGDGVLAGVEDDGQHPVLVVETGDGPLRCQVTTAAERLGLPALRVLASAVGTQVQLRLRERRPEEPGRSPWVLIGVGHDGTWVFPGLDRPNEHWLGVPQNVAPKAVASSRVEPATVLRRWRDAVARQGRRGATGTNRDRLMADAAWLRAHASGHRADLLERLADAAAAGTRGFDGRFHADVSDLPRRWLAVAAVC
ncbi:hypothetical protein KBX18_01045 [Corynebacterium sp. CCUG 69979]|uniref:hypothetical protein n=1 Tax=Corynebacterium sp. CCUG 69979 TaxID=2823890 RepID=UPI00210B5109|nr:hypothetical protein [Corynebacterium sp. CCUG 69979]MCQ4624155.1 hypothetical protein [Corynebacterium sp. CCUG 69979]